MKQPPANTNKKFQIDPSGLDPQGFAARYTQVYARLVTIASGVSGESSAAEDIVQQGAAIAFERRDRYQAGTNFAAWMAEIVRRVALNHRHRNQRRRTYASPPQALDVMSSEPPAAADPSQVVATGGQLAEHQAAFDDRVVRALDGLEPVARCCLLLRVVHELPYDEISELLDIPAGTAMSHVHRSKKFLRERLSSTSSRASPTP